MAGTFPTSFIWGAATSAYQIEGAVDTDGRSPSIWDTFASRPGTISDASSGAVACDHYHRFPEDVRLMRELGLTAYRFSIAWPRVLPKGDGAVNDRGLDFYDRLTDELLSAGIRPYATLYHWDLPQRLQDNGGWPNRNLVDSFVRYADVVSRRLGDRIRDWFTINEPLCITLLGYQNGEHAPGIQDWSQALAAAHHVLLAHGAATPVVRDNAKNARVGIVLNLTPCHPASDSDADQAATRWVDGLLNRWYLDPLYGRGYPEDTLREHLARGHVSGLDFVRDGDIDIIAEPTDVLGVNIYTRALVRSDDIPEEANRPRLIPEPPADQKTDMGWEVFPEGLHATLLRLHREYDAGELLITENGAAYADGPGADGAIHDHRRIAFHRSHLEQCLRAIADGVPLRGYFAWSLLDNFEWAFGYTKRFGLIWVDFDSHERIIKDSARWYAAVIRGNRLPTEAP